MNSACLSHSADLNRLIAVAAADRRFCRLLLANPQEALARGYQGETFSLPPHERNWMLSIRASSLSDLASQLVQRSTVPAPAVAHADDTAALADDIASDLAQLQGELAQVRRMLPSGTAAERLEQVDRSLQRVAVTSRHLVWQLHQSPRPQPSLAS